MYKYPRTPHLPFSPGASNDDILLATDKHFQGKQVVITEKMDGENSTVYRDGYHARSLDSVHRDYHSWLLAYIKTFQYQLENDERVCGEYLYAKHSIFYDNLESYFYGFSFWKGDRCLDWGKTKKKFKELGIVHVPELYIGPYESGLTERIAERTVARGGEGIVVRTFDSFDYDDFAEHIAKYVRPNHVQTDKHWSLSTIEQNKLLLL